MPTFLLWNVQKKALDGYVVRLAEEHKIDVVLLVERPAADSTLVAILKTNGYHRVSDHERFGLYTRLEPSRFERLALPVAEAREEYWRFWLSASLDVVLATVHGPDRRNYSDDTSTWFFQRISSNVQKFEQELGHKRTLVIGDFNANPFDASIVSAAGLHAIAVQHVGGRSDRSILKRRCEFFYNPMWRCYGAGRNAPPATYYHNGSTVHELFWHMLDQLVLRPEMLPFFVESRLRILSQAGPHKLVTTSGFPDKANTSDHLPILFRLRPRRGGTIHARR